MEDLKNALTKAKKIQQFTQQDYFSSQINNYTVKYWNFNLLWVKLNQRVLYPFHGRMKQTQLHFLLRLNLL
jgi:hypothetical protein